VNDFYIYAHYKKDTDELFYIGKGKGNRAWNIRDRNIYWSRIVTKHGYYVKIILKDLEESRAFIQEILAIKELKPVANLTLGGYGGNTASNYSEEELENKRKKCSTARKEFWSKKTKEEKELILKNSHKALSKKWADMCPIEKSKEQSRRSKMRKLKKVLCLNNNKIYNSRADAAKDLNLKSTSKISKVATGKATHYKKYKFQYITSE
jgi:hypothetical protein